MSYCSLYQEEVAYQLASPDLGHKQCQIAFLCCLFHPYALDFPDSESNAKNRTVDLTCFAVSKLQYFALITLYCSQYIYCMLQSVKLRNNCEMLF